MKKLSRLILAVTLSLTGYLFAGPQNAQAIPAFAKKYDVPCTMCHSAFPKLNDFGVNFRDNGYQMGSDSDLPTNQDKSYVPIGFRTTVGYMYASQDHVQGVTPGNSTTNYSSGLGSVGMDFLMAGTLDRDISFLVVPTGENSVLGGEAAFSLESAWIRFDNLMGSPMLNLKIGFGDLDIPFSEHRTLTMNTPYAVYHYLPGTPYNSTYLPVGDSTSTNMGSLDLFEMGSHQGVLQLMGHTTNSMGNFRYSLNAVSNNQYGGHDTGYYVHVTQSMMGGGYSSGYRGGLFYLNLPIPTVLDNQTALAPTPPSAGIPPVGSSGKPIQRFGVDLSGNFLENKLNIFGVYMMGQDDKEMFGPGVATDDAKFWGGFVEANYLHDPHNVVIARYDIIRNTTQPVATFGPVTDTNGFNDVDGMTLGYRHAMVIHTRGEVWLHSEFNETTNKKTAFDGTDQKNDMVFLGVDFAF